MMDVKEKLVEIIQNSVGGCARHRAEVVADGLLANGVTVQHRLEEKQATSDNGKQSNADRIRAMSDEELISLLCGGYGGFDCHACKIGDQRQCDMECNEHCRQWLQQPAEDEEMRIPRNHIISRKKDQHEQLHCNQRPAY